MAHGSESMYVLQGREEDLTIHDEVGMRHYLGEWSKRMGRSSANPLAVPLTLPFALVSLFVLQTPLDLEAKMLISKAAQRVSVVTAISPKALIDVLFVGIAATRLIGQLARLYGGRPGALGMMKLMRQTVSHLAITGGIAVGDSVMQSIRITPPPITANHYQSRCQSTNTCAASTSALRTKSGTSGISHSLPSEPTRRISWAPFEKTSATWPSTSPSRLITFNPRRSTK